MKSESIIQQEIMLEAAKFGIKLMRNNVGALQDKEGRFIRYGLLNDSPLMNKRIKSSDLIGIIPPHGQFIAIEVKKEGWVYKGDEREVAQAAFIHYIVSRGGIGGFCCSTLDFCKLIGKA